MCVVLTVMVLLVVFSFKCLCQKNNVCPTFEDYYTLKNNSKCWYDLAAEYKAPDIIRKLGYPLEEYNVTTKDGYILTLFRIPNKNPFFTNQPILLQHGIYATCANFLGLGKRSLALLLHDAGYDVWLGNYRGNEYSEGHVNMTVNDKKFWDFSIDEIALYDLPAIIDTINRETGQKGNLIFLGHSLGTAIGLMYASAFPEEAKSNIKFLALLCPVYTLSNMKSPYRFAAPFLDIIMATVNELDLVRFASQAQPLKGFLKQLCLESPVLMTKCLHLINLFFGLNNQMGPELVPVLFNQIPGGSPLRVLKHSSDFLKNKFTRYDYGPTQNIKNYNSSKAPKYDISKIEIPTFIMYGVSDWATTTKDAWNLYYNLPKEVRYGIYEVNTTNFNHEDFVFGRHAKEIVYDKLMMILNEITIQT